MIIAAQKPLRTFHSLLNQVQTPKLSSPCAALAVSSFILLLFPNKSFIKLVYLSPSDMPWAFLPLSLGVYSFPPGYSLLPSFTAPLLLHPIEIQPILQGLVQEPPTVFAGV